MTGDAFLKRSGSWDRVAYTLHDTDHGLLIAIGDQRFLLGWREVQRIIGPLAGMIGPRLPRPASTSLAQTRR